ncbi:MAG TPA: apolipoprotein N-acyltransferase [Stellaceae bacterium]|nr:apolipoprotein N-acyltransferase [Stellaceae bacterium]
MPTSLAFEADPAFGPWQRLAAWTGALAGWRRYGMATLLGVVAAAALPPVDLVPLLAVSFSGLVWLAAGCRSGRQAFALGWSFSFGFLVAGLYWIAAALFVDIASFWWLVPFAAAGLPALLSIYGGAALLLYHWLRPQGLARAPCLAACWLIGEWLRGHLFTGFPWNLVGYAWSGGFPGGTAVLQVTAVIGIYGLSLLTVAAAALPASLGDPPRAAARHLRRIAPPVVGLLVVIALGVGGWLRLAAAPAADVPGLRLRLVQPSIAESLKWDPAARAGNFERLLALSAEPAARPVTDIIWPEAAATFLLNRDPAHRAAIAAVAPPGGLVITGALRSDPLPGPAQHFWNSLAVIDGAGDLVASFDKFHLVPFGEYVPFRNILPIDKITPGNVDFTPGPGPRTLALPGLPPVGPLICYEVIFPHAVVDESHRPQWLLNVTNDAWYGFTSGPFQHFAIARVRAVEEGLPLVRAANNGISGFVDAYGRVRERLGLDAVGVLDAPLPAALPGPTPYARLGDRLFWVMLIGGLVPAAALIAARARLR